MYRGLISSEAVLAGQQPDLFLGGTCNYRTGAGLVRNPTRDRLMAWLEGLGLTFFEAQIVPGSYDWERDHLAEVRARTGAALRLYQLGSEALGAGTVLEVFDDARHGRESLVWLSHPALVLEGLGDAETLENNRGLKEKLGGLIHGHLIDLLKSGTRLRQDLGSMLEDADCIRFCSEFREVRQQILLHFDRA